MYSFGVLVYELMHGRTPHGDTNNLGALAAAVIVLGSVIGFTVVCVISGAGPPGFLAFSGQPYRVLCTGSLLN